METRYEERPYGTKPERPERLYAREIKRELLKIVLVIGAYFFLQMVVTGVIEMAILLSSGAFDGLMRGAMDMAESGALDYDGLMESAQASVQGDVARHTGMITIVGAVCCLPIFLLLRGRRLFTTDITTRHAPLALPAFLKLWVVAMGAQLVFNIGASLLNRALESSGHSATDLLEETMGMLQTPSGIVYICLIGPVVEEIIFRGAIMKSLERFGLNFAIIISSLVFGLFHIFTVQAVFAFFMGIILGYIASRYSLKWSILCHILINSVATGLDWFGAIGGGSAGGSPFFLLANAALIAFFVGGVALLLLERWRFREQRVVGAPVRIPGSPARTGAALWGAAFTSVPLLLYIGVTVFAGLALIGIAPRPPLPY
jgi:membrane protease YdiL (CAAX protease family)